MRAMSINDYMTNDHRECDKHFDQADVAAKAQDFVVLEREATEFLRRITRHIEIEDRLLFPAFEARNGMSGPSAVMRQEHRQMETLFAEMRQAVAAKDAAAYRKSAGRMMEMLEQHNQKEEMMLYPMIDSVVGSEVGMLLAKVKAMAEK